MQQLLYSTLSDLFDVGRMWIRLEPTRAHVLFSIYLTPGRGGGEGFGEVWLNHGKINLMPTFILSWHHPILLPLSARKPCDLPEKLSNPLPPGDNQWLLPYKVILVAQCWKRLLPMTLSVKEFCCWVNFSCRIKCLVSQPSIWIVTGYQRLEKKIVTLSPAIEHPRNPTATKRK